MLNMIQECDAKEAINGIAYSNLSKKYNVLPFRDVPIMEKSVLEELMSGYETVDGFIDFLKKEHRIIATHLSVKTEMLPVILKMSGHMLDVSKYPNSFFSGRTTELTKMNIIFHKKIKNNLLLIGNPGVGKTRLVEEYAIKHQLNNLYVVECAKLVGSTEYRGSFEQRVVEIMDYAKHNNLILFFDEIHALLNLGKSTGGISITDILKPYLLEEQMVFIGATTFKEANYFVEDEAFKRRFSIMKIHEPLDEELFQIKKNFENNVLQCEVLQDEELSEVICRLREELPQMYFPDKLVDFLDYLYSYRKTIGWEEKLESIMKEYIEDQKG